MGVEKGGYSYAARGVAFFHLFDWNNNKSRRKLSTNEIASQEETKHEAGKDRVLPKIELRPNDSIDDVDGGGGECASPTSDGNNSGSTTKAPGVVARLMGLDFLPKSGTVTSSSTPLVKLECACCREESLDREFSSRISGVSSGNEVCSCRPSGMKRQKMANGPVERFQTETLPWKKSVKSLPVSHQNMPSPVKKQHFISSGNAADIVEAAAKILDARRQGNSSTSPPKASSYPSRVCDRPECSAASERPSSLLRSSLLGPNGSERLEKNFGDSEDESTLRGSSVCNGRNSVVAKGKGKAASLAPQTGGNVQIKIDTSAGKNGTNKPYKRRSNSQKMKVERKGSSENSSIVLKQNNQKQNALEKRDLLPGKLGGSRQLHEKSLSRPGKGASVKNEPTNKLPDATVSRYSKECQVVDGFVKGKPASKIATYTRQKKMRVGVKISPNKELSDGTFVNKKEKLIQHVVVDNKQKPNEDRRRGAISFTFTSPVLKSASANLSPATRMEKEEDGSCSSLVGFRKVHITDTKDMASSTVDLKAMTGENLGRLLEQKLRELTSELDSSQEKSVKTEIGIRSTSQDSLIAPKTKASVTEFAHIITPGADEEIFGPLSYRGSPSIEICETNRAQSEEEAECKVSCSSDGVSGPDPLQPSPSSIFEACFSDVNYESSAIFPGSNGISLDSRIQIEQHSAPILLEDKPSLKVEMESISSSPSFMQVVDKECEDIPHCCRENNLKLPDWEISYVREILTASELQDEDLILRCDVGGLDSLIFSHLEHKRSNIPGGGNEDVARLNRKVLFDCVIEHLSQIFTLNLHAGFWSSFWTNGKMMAQNEFAEKIYKEISMWGSLRGGKVDELVEKDMNNYSRRWVEFETDVLEIRLQIEEKVLTTLVDEIVAEFLV